MVRTLGDHLLTTGVRVTKSAMQSFGSWRSRFANRMGPQPIIWATLLVIVALSAVGLLSAMNLYAQYTHARSSAQAGMVHLRRVEADLLPLLAHPALPDVHTLDQMQTELSAAEQNFSATRHDLSAGALGAATSVPGPGGTLTSVAALAAAADDVCLAGLDLTTGLRPVIVALTHGSLFAPDTTQTGVASTSGAPWLTQAMLDTLTTKFEQALQRLNAAEAAVHSVNLASLPAQIVTPQQMTQLRGVVERWPTIQTRLATVDTWLHLAPALLGMQRPERFLVEIMDRAEMRSTGGFIGAYGVMTLSQGRVEPFTLADIFALDRPYVERAGYPSAPAAYPWWPFKGFGLRDSNLSPDFPTSARAGITLLQQEGGPEAQGVIALNATTIERLLKIIGPVQVDSYHVTVTDRNLESLIRLYTETSAQRDGNDLPVGDQLTTIHERFTALLGRELMNKVRTLQGQQYAPVVQALWKSLTLKDMQIYVSDAATEAQIAQLGFDGGLAHGVGDAVTIIDANIGANKASALTKVTYADAVTLDAQGMATHHLTIAYHFDSSVDPGLYHYLYHRDYYLTYLRVYVPQNAHLLSFDGFNNGDTAMNRSDEPGRQMWGGLVQVHDGVPYVLHFVWSVPAASTHDAQAGHWSYAVDYQHQSGANQWLALSVTAPGGAHPIVSYDGALSKDMNYSVAYR